MKPSREQTTQIPMTRGRINAKGPLKESLEPVDIVYGSSGDRGLIEISKQTNLQQKQIDPNLGGIITVMGPQRSHWMQLNLSMAVIEAEVCQREVIYAFKHKTHNILVTKMMTVTRVSSRESLSPNDSVYGIGRGQATMRGKPDLSHDSLDQFSLSHLSKSWKP